MPSPPVTEALDVAACLRLIDQQPVGRVAFVADGAPMVLPVNFLREDDKIVFRTVAGSKLIAASMAQPVAFEVDDFDPATRTGWSVVIHGLAETVLPGEPLDRLEARGLDTWVEEGAHHWVRIHPDRITGRRISRR